MRSVTVFATAMLFCCVATAVAAQPENVKPYTIPRKAAAAQKLPDAHEVRLGPKRTLQEAGAEPRIINGIDADEGEFPYYVLWDGLARCGASLIHDDILLTAAHCGPPPIGNDVVIGAYATPDSLMEDWEKAEHRQIEKRCFHPDYNRTTFENDVMVLKINSPSSLKCVALNGDPKKPNVGEELVAIGFGRISPDNDTLSNILQKVTLQAVSHAECNAAYDNGIVENVMLCAGVPEGDKNICQGDSGGLVLEQRDGIYVQVGIPSFVSSLGCLVLPSVNTRVSGVKSWIHQMICKLSDTPPESCGEFGYDVPAGCGNIFKSYGGCQEQDKACEEVDSPFPGFTTIYDDCPADATSFFECQSCAIYPTDGDGQTQCNSCSICSGTVAFDCSNIFSEILPDFECAIHECDGTCTASDGGGGDEQCEDVPGWHDCEGKNCTWYAEDHNCLKHGSGHENDGYVAKEACCICGGGTVGGGGGRGDGGEEHGGLRKMKEK